MLHVCYLWFHLLNEIPKQFSLSRTHCITFPIQGCEFSLGPGTTYGIVPNSNYIYMYIIGLKFACSLICLRIQCILIVKLFLTSYLTLQVGNFNDTLTANVVKGKANHGNRIIQPKKACTAFMHLCGIRSIQFTN